MNTIYSVKGGNIGNGKLSKLELKFFEFITSKEFLDTVKVGDSLSEKVLKVKFGNWNKEKMSVNVSTLINEKICRKVAFAFVNGVKDGTIKSNVIPVISVNKVHGNFSVDFKNVLTMDSEYSEKELTVKTGSKAKTAFEFLTNYLSKESVQLEIENTDGKNDKLNAIITILESMKD